MEHWGPQCKQWFYLWEALRRVEAPGFASFLRSAGHVVKVWHFGKGVLISCFSQKSVELAYLNLQIVSILKNLNQIFILNNF